MSGAPGSDHPGPVGVGDERPPDRDEIELLSLEPINKIGDRAWRSRLTFHHGGDGDPAMTALPSMIIQPEPDLAKVNFSPCSVV